MNRKEVVKPVLFCTPGEVIEMIEVMRKLLLVRALLSKISSNQHVNQRLNILFTSSTLPIGIVSHALRKIYANWAYAIHGTTSVAEYAYICEVLGQNYNPNMQYIHNKYWAKTTTLYLLPLTLIFN